MLRVEKKGRQRVRWLDAEGGGEGDRGRDGWMLRAEEKRRQDEMARG